MTSNSIEVADREGTGLWLCLHFRQLPVEIFSRGDFLQKTAAGALQKTAAGAQPTDTPVVITSRQRILYRNQAARDVGIRIGSSMDTAYTLSDEITSFERDEEKEFSALSHLAQWAYQFTPGVSIKAPHSLLLDIKGCLKLFGGLEKLKSRIEEKLSELGYTASTGIHTTPLAALCFAEAGFTEATSTETLLSLPITCLRVDKKIIESLRQMGIQNIGGLLGLPMDGLNRRFGVFFTDYLQRLIGEKPDPQKFISETPRFFSELTFLSDITNLQSLIFPVKRLLSELCNFLQARQLHINQMTFRLSHRNHDAKSFSIYLADPENDVAMFLMLTQLQLDKINAMPEVDNLCLIANTFYPADTVSGDLFHHIHSHERIDSHERIGSHERIERHRRIHSKADLDRTNRLLNMFRVRLGPQTCFGLSLANDHRPEKAWKTVRLNQKDYWFPENEEEENPRPLYLLNVPQELRTIDHLPGLGGQLELTRGPERIDFGWWDGSNSARDYYIGRHQCGALYWVFSEKRSGKWFLHGIFS